MSTAGDIEVKIRRMRRGDIEAVLALDKEVGKGRSQITYRDLVATDPGGLLDLSLIAEYGDGVIGFLLARLAYVYVPFTEVCIIHGIAVKPDYQKRGIGSKMVKRLLEYCQDEGIPTVRTLVHERDAELRTFAEFLGFRRSAIVNYDKTFEG